MDQIPWLRTKSIIWRVRFDHAALATSLAALNFPYARFSVSILNVEQDYDRVFKSFSAAIRTQIRKGSRRGLSVRNTSDPSDLTSYQQIYSSLAAAKGWHSIYPIEVTKALLQVPNLTRFVVADFEGTVVGGALFLRDGNSVYYVHGVADRDFNHLYPSRAVLDAGVRWACETGVEFVNFGRSGDNKSLALFKSLWGTHIEHNWEFSWNNRFWDQAGKVKRRILLLPPSPPEGSHAQLSNATPWSQRAGLGELESVFILNAPERRQLMMHGASLAAAKTALSMLREQRSSRLSILDFGCGNGRMIRFFGKKGWDVLGIDVTVEMLKQAKKYALPSTARLAHFDGLSIPVKDQSIGMVWVCGVLKYTLFPPGARCRHENIEIHKGNPNGASTNGTEVFVPTYFEVAKEMHRVLKPGGIVAQYEMWVDEHPEVFIRDFERVGFVKERVSVLHKYEGRREKACLWRAHVQLPRWFVVFLAEICAKSRARRDNPYKLDTGFRDYLFVWRKPVDKRL
jgi:ubiquinone/menaquinone biosynthesis C-methylase UbiE